MKSIFVTGAASGIGRATAQLFGKRGFAVGCWDVDVDGARAVAESLPNASHGRLDVTNEESWSAAVADFDAHYGRMDVLFNCAGILKMGRFEAVTPAECRRQLDVNVMGVILGIQKSLPLLEQTVKMANDAAIVSMSSASAVYGQPELAVYSATKFAVRALTEALDIELRPKKIRVSDVMPGYVATPMVASQTHRSKTLERLGVHLKAEDVAAVVWKAAHGKRLHHIPQVDVSLLGRLSALPAVSRTIMNLLAKREG